MLETTNRDGPLQVEWRQGLSVLNLRGSPDDLNFVVQAGLALGVELPLAPCTTQRSRSGVVEHVVWAGPDDWFVIAAAGQALPLGDALRRALLGLHCAVTEVSSGYHVLRLGGKPVVDVLAQGCPLDLHPRAFGVGRSAGSHFFKASIWLWQTRADPQFELLVRRSFKGYVQLMLQRCTAECGSVDA